MGNCRRVTRNVAYMILTLAVPFLAGSIQTPAHGNPPALICLSLSPNSCPSTPPVFTGQKGSLLRVYVVAQEVGSFQRFDISVKTNASVLYPINASTVNSVVAQGMPVGGWECINGGGAYCGPIDGPGVVSVTGWGYYATSAPTNGMIFSITFNVTGSGLNVPIIFPSGCSATSVPGGICVNLNGPTVGVQNSSFTNILPSTGDFAISANSTFLKLARGMMGTFSINLTGYSGFFGTITLSVASSSYAISEWFSSTVVALRINGTAASDLNVLSVASMASGDYTVTVNATSGHISHVLTLVVDIQSQLAVNAIQNGDFSNGLDYWTTGSTYSVSYGIPPRNYPIVQVTNATESCTPKVLHGSSFLDVWNTLGSAGYAQESFTVPSGGAMLAFLSWGWITSGSESATVSIVSSGRESVLDSFAPVNSVNSTGGCTGNLPEMKVYDVSNYSGQTVQLRFAAEAYTCCRADSLFDFALVVPKGSGGLRDFSIFATPDSLTVPRTTNGIFIVTLSSLNGFNTTVMVSSTVTASSPMWPYQFPPIVFSQNIVSITSGKSINVTGTLEATTSTPASSYTITVVGTSRRIQASATVTASVPSVALLYEILGPTNVEAGGSAVFVNNFTNVGDFPSRIIRVTVTSDFGSFTLLDDSSCPGNTATIQIGNGLCDIPNAPLISPGGNTTLRLSFTIPDSVASGVHGLTETVQWQFRNPFPIIWENGESIKAPFQTYISTGSNPSPGPGPSSQPGRISPAGLMKLVEQYGSIILAWTLAASAAFATALVLIARSRRPAKSTGLGGPEPEYASGVSHCSNCNSPIPVAGQFCPGCGARKNS